MIFMVKVSGAKQIIHTPIIHQGKLIRIQPANTTEQLEAKETIRRMTDNQRNVLSLIPAGADNPIPVKTISNIAELEVRTVNEIIHSLTVQFNIPICATRSEPNGVFIALTENEKIIGTQSIKNQANTQLKRVESVLKADIAKSIAIKKELINPDLFYPRQLSMLDELNSNTN